MEANFGRLVGDSPPMQRLYAEIARVAPTDATVLIHGESGTGKDLVARSIHDLSRRCGAPFLALNCGAMSPTLIESELFGHERGSFTGAAQRHAGHFERASGGTLFLDEIVEMPIELQARLLRVLEAGTLLRIGGESVIETDVRVVVATNRSIPQAMAQGRLRKDLYYRCSVFPIELPPLRQRPGDVALLAAHFMERLNAAAGTDKRLTPQALAALERCQWPGNVRQLKNALERAFILAGAGREVRYHADVEASPPVALSMPIVVGTSLDELKRRMILDALARCRSRRKAAAALGISLKTLYNRLNLYRRAAAADE
jgi:transcriptional regulator with PAS, ATPase and Fis domain